MLVNRLQRGFIEEKGKTVVPSNSFFGEHTSFVRRYYLRFSIRIYTLVEMKRLTDCSGAGGRK